MRKILIALVLLLGIVGCKTEIINIQQIDNKITSVPDVERVSVWRWQGRDWRVTFEVKTPSGTIEAVGEGDTLIKAVEKAVERAKYFQACK